MYSISPSPLSLSLSLFGIVGSRAHFIVPPLSRVALELSDARCNALNSPSLSLSLSLSLRERRARRYGCDAKDPRGPLIKRHLLLNDIPALPSVLATATLSPRKGGPRFRFMLLASMGDTKREGAGGRLSRSRRG